MRHLTGIVLAIVMTAALFCAATWGYVRFLAQSSRLPAGASLLSDHHALFALGALAGTGLLAGILIAAPRISPLAAGLPGLLLVGLSVLYLVSVRRADELIPLRSHVFGTGFETLLARGLLGAAGLAMIVPLFVPSRWRSRGVVKVPAPFEPAPDAYPDLGTTQTIAGGSLLADWAETRPQPRVEPGRSQAPWGPVDPANQGGSGSTPDYS